MARIPSWIATEELEEDPIVAPEVAEVPSETVEAQLVEVDGLDRQIESLIDNGAELTEDADNVEALEDTVAASQETGGLDETAAEITEIATESYCSKWGIRRQRIAKENFGESTTRIQATKVALEALGDAKKGLFARFLELIQRIINAAKDAWLAFNNAGKSLGKRADKLQAQAKATFSGGSKTASEQQLKGGWVKYCVIDDKADAAALMAFARKSQANFQSAASATDSMLKKINENIKGSTTEMKAAKVELGSDEGGDSLAAQQMNEVKDSPKAADSANALKDAFAAARNAGSGSKDKSGSPSDAMDVESAAFPGNLFLTYSTVKGMPITTMNTKELTGEAVIGVLSQTQISEAIGSVKVLAGTMEAHIKSFRYYDAGLKELKDVVGIAQEVMNETAPAARKDAELVLKVSRQAVLDAETSRRCFKQAMTNAGQGLSGLISASLAAYK